MISSTTMEAVTDHLPIPHHITDLPVIDPDQAAELAIQFELADPDDKNAALIGLHYCRDRQITPETALEQGAQELNLDTLIAPFTQSKDDLKPIIKSETQRIKKRDQSIFALEQSFHGLNQPFPKSIRDLNQLCQHLSTPQTPPQVIRWDLLRHYTVIFEEARMSFDPLAFLDELFNALENPSFYSAFLQRDKQPIYQPYYQSPQGRLVTHTQSLGYLSSALTRGSLTPDPELCLTAGQVVYLGSRINAQYQTTYIFDRNVLEKLYCLMPYTDTDVEWEKELRAHEPINTNLALGRFHTQEFALMGRFNSIPGMSGIWGQDTSTCGAEIIAEWENHYLTHGYLPNPEEY